jgi:putative hydrolase of the HAD superfamily
VIFLKGLHGIKAVSFDLDDTLYDNVPCIKRAEELYLEHLTEIFGLTGRARDLKWWSQERQALLCLRPELDNDVTELRVQELIYCLNQEGIAVSDAQARELTAWFIRVRSEIPVPESSKKLLCDLGARYPLACISNGNSDTVQDGLAPFFKWDLRPSVRGARTKPYPDLFVDFATKAGVRPCEVLHVGDDPFTDVEGAVGAGCQCAWLRRGIAGKTADWDRLKILPSIVLDRLEELRGLLLS